MKSETPLVSVVVITYNSENTICETLESIRKQTYSNIELIITDDCSKDKTIELCRKWLDDNFRQFANTELITSEYNTGISANCNRGYDIAKGKWIKGIAGDDVLISTCLENNIDYILANPNTDLLFSRFDPFGDEELIQKISKYNYGAFYLSNKEMFYKLLTTNPFPAPTLFIRKSCYIEIGKFDENIPLLEDWPFWIKALQHNKKIAFNNICTVNYRVSNNSISLSKNINPLYIKTLNIFNKELSSIQIRTNILIWFYYNSNILSTSKNSIIRLISHLLKLVNPISYYYKYINRKMTKYDIINDTIK